jgi:alpha-tubulin suppressor-like RCC1 family protein
MPTPTPTKLPGLPKIVELSAPASATQMYARDESGAVWCWGLASSGQCGAPEVPQTVPRQVLDDKAAPLTGIKRVRPGSVFGCVINSADDVLCTGENGLGQLGRGTMGDKSALPLPIDRAGWSGRAVDLECMTNSCCLIDDKGSVACWGNNDLGQVGAGRTEKQVLVPAKVPLTRAARTLHGGDHTMCALLDDGGIECWGAAFRNVFPGVSEVQRSPIRLTALDGKDVIDLSIGTPKGHYARIKNGSVLGWGTDGLHVGTPDNVPSLTGATVIASAADHGCAIIAGGIQCWGANATGQLGDGSMGHPAPAPVTWK